MRQASRLPPLRRFPLDLTRRRRSQDASHNALAALPPSVGHLQRLAKLNLADNGLAQLPPEIGDLFGE